MILEEDFEKSGEAWYDPQELEHGNVHWSLNSQSVHDCVTIMAVTFTLRSWVQRCICRLIECL